VAYFFCELFWRHRAAGLSEDHSLQLPLTQTDIGDALGLTSVHVNRVLQGLRRDGLIHVSSPTAVAARRRSAAKPRAAEPGTICISWACLRRSNAT
jgi:hypothetical protein